MWVLIANLRFLCHGYAVRIYMALVVCVAFALGLGWALVSTEDPEAVAITSLSTPAAGVLFAWGTGAFVAWLQTELLSKPFAFCLPGRSIVLRRLVFVVGLGVAFIVSLIWPAQDVPGAAYRLQFFCTGLVVYFAGIRIGLSWAGGLVWIFLAPPAFFLSLRPLAGLSQRHFAFPSTISLVALSLGAATAMWWWLGRTNLSQRCCGRPFHRLLRARDRRQRTRHDRTDRMPLPHAMEGGRPLSGVRHVWNMRYAWRLAYGGSRLDISMAASSGLAAAVLAWIMPMFGSFFVAFFSMGLELNDSRDLPIPGNLLIAGGRWERFLARMALLTIRAGALILAMIVGLFVMDLMGPYLPVMLMRKEAVEMGVGPVSLSLAILCTASMPVGRLLATALRGQEMVKLVVGYGAITLIQILLMPRHHTSWPEVPWIYVLVAHLLLWSLCAWGIYRVTKRIDLARR